jgi:pheromone shutdown protein TraB
MSSTCSVHNGVLKCKCNTCVIVFIAYLVLLYCTQQQQQHLLLYCIKQWYLKQAYASYNTCRLLKAAAMGDLVARERDHISGLWQELGVEECDGRAQFPHYDVDAATCTDELLEAHVVRS